MEKNEREERLTQYDPGTSLGYNQGMEFQYLNPTQPLELPLSSQERRLRELREIRRHRTVPLSQAGQPRSPLSEQAEQAAPRFSIAKAALIISLSLVASRFLGLLQKALFTAVFRPSAVTEAFNQASLVPDLIFNIVAGGALMSAFIPVFNAYMVDKRDPKEAWHLASAALCLTIAGMVILVGLAMIFTRQVIWPYNYTASPEQLDFITTLTRIMLVQALIMGAGVVITSILNARKHFLLPAIGTLLYPLGSIIGLIPGLILVALHVPNDTAAIYCTTAGVVLGALLMVCIQIPGLAKVGMQFRLTFDWKHSGMQQILRQMLPRLANTVMLNFSTGVDRVLLSYLVLAVGSAGFITVYTLAFSVVSIPLSFVMALGTATFPTMAEYAAAGETERFVEIVLEALRSILFVAIPCSIGLLILSLPVIQALFEHGSFTFQYAQLTAIPLLGFALGLPGMAVIEILTRAFYALRNSRMPVLVSIWQFLLKIALSLLLLDPVAWGVEHGLGTLQSSALTQPLRIGAWGMAALAFATSLAVLAEALLLLWLLHKRIGGLRLRALVLFTARVGIATLALAVSLLITQWILDFVLPTSGLANSSLAIQGILFAFLKLLLCIAIGGVIYLRAARFLHLLGTEQLRPVNRLLVRLRLSWL